MKWSTQTMFLELDKESGIVTIKPNETFKGPETAELAKINIDIALEKAEEFTKGLLVYLPPFYVDVKATSYYKKNLPPYPIALVGDSFFKKMIGNFLLSLASNERTVKVFTDEEEALSWLKQQIDKNNLSKTA